MHRFFISPGDIEDGFVRIGGEDAIHIGRVLRLKEGDEIALCDGNCLEYRAVLRDIGKKGAVAELLEAKELRTEPRCSVTLYQGIPKAGKLETIIQKGTELGIVRFVPFSCERSIVKPWSGGDDKCARYQRVAYEAAKQSHRGRVPVVEAPLSFAGLCGALVRHTLAITAWEEERALSLKSVLRGGGTEDIAIVIGPEGGLSAGEVERLAQAGARPVTLGPRILRTETAGPAMAAMILYETEEAEA